MKNIFYLIIFYFYTNFSSNFSLLINPKENLNYKYKGDFSYLKLKSFIKIWFNEDLEYYNFEDVLNEFIIAAKNNEISERKILNDINSYILKKLKYYKKRKNNKFDHDFLFFSILSTFSTIFLYYLKNNIYKKSLDILINEYNKIKFELENKFNIEVYSWNEINENNIVTTVFKKNYYLNDEEFKIVSNLEKNLFQLKLKDNENIFVKEFNLNNKKYYLEALSSFSLLTSAGALYGFIRNSIKYNFYEIYKKYKNIYKVINSKLENKNII